MKNENRKNSKKKERSEIIELVFAFLFVSIFFFLLLGTISAAPTGPDSVVIDSNETKGANSAYTLNTSGGYITTINITANTQNLRWKAFVGQVTGSFTLDDASGSSIYDWSLTSVSGEVYATRNSSTISWSNIKCANTTLMGTENTLMNHTNSQDNITRTFNDTTHSSFFVGSVSITANACPTLNTYINNATQNTDFEEMVLSDSTNFTAGGSLIYSTIIENNVVGFDARTYDFQMLAPENGAQGFSGATAYYLYVELN